RMEIALTYIFGVGRTRARETLAATNVDPDKRARDLTDEELIRLRDHLEANYRIEGDLRREVAADIRRKVEIGTYQGISHRRNLPVRGQLTRTNARTRKGPKRTVAGKKKAGRKQRTTTRPRKERTHTCRQRHVTPPQQRRRRSGVRNARTSPTDTPTSRAPSTTPSCPSPIRPE